MSKKALWIAHSISNGLSLSPTYDEGPGYALHILSVAVVASTFTALASAVNSPVADMAMNASITGFAGIAAAGVGEVTGHLTRDAKRSIPYGSEGRYGAIGAALLLSFTLAGAYVADDINSYARSKLSNANTSSVAQAPSPATPAVK